MVELRALVDYADALLDAAAFDDYCPNGLQVEGRAEVRRLVTGVSATAALLDAALAWEADAVVVHHGYFWRGEDARVTGYKRARLRRLLINDVGLLAYHLPLDAHPQLGNNAQLAARLGLQVEGVAEREAPRGLLWFGTPGSSMSAQALAALIGERLQREALLIGDPARAVRRLAWCTGAAQGFIEAAHRIGADAYLSGEVSEQTVHFARENGMVYFAAGHHATERYGVQALGEHLAAEFALEHRFIDIDNPV